MPTALKDKVQNALDEGRTLVIGVQVLLGFQFRSFFEPAFSKLPAPAVHALVIALAGLLCTLALLMLAPSRHRLVEGGNDSTAVHWFTMRCVELALLPFALGIGADLYAVGWRLGGGGFAAAAGISGALVAVATWYGSALVPNHNPPGEDEQMEKTELKTKIRHVLTEIRVVLPGSQALLGFQFATLFMESFESLPVAVKRVHFAALGCIAFSVVLLMLPAAFHRLVEKGESTERFHRFDSTVMMGATIPLALGLAGDVFVVTRKVGLHSAGAAAISAAVGAGVLAVWFGIPLAVKSRTGRPGGRLAHPVEA